MKADNIIILAYVCSHQGNTIPWIFALQQRCEFSNSMST